MAASQLDVPAGLGAVARFNPQFWKPQELRAIFVARQSELAQLLRRVQGAPATTSPQHVLVTGHRGMGKSTLLHRLALAVDDDPALHAQTIALIFREEQYTAVGLDKFWRNALDALSEALEREAPSRPAATAEVATLDELNASLEAVPEAEAREAQALSGLRTWADAHSRRLLLLVDNTDMLLHGLRQSRAGVGGDGDRALWRLREVLSQDARFFWLGCAYAPLEADQGYEHPFHEFFAPLRLHPLAIEDMRATFMALARTFGVGRGLSGAAAEAEMRHIVGRQPERLETLLRLAGGNPRTTVLLYQLLAAGGRDSVHADLQRLLDDMSPLYKDRLETLAVQPRQLLATLMEHWAPMAARELAHAAAMPVTQVNAQLSRLEADGWVHKVRLSGTRRHGYQASERFFNIWYLMRLAPRRLRQRLTWLVEFMRLWFSPDELRDLAHERSRRLRQGQGHDERQLEYSRALSLALPEDSSARGQLELMLLPHTVRGRIGELLAFDFNTEDNQYLDVEDYQRRFKALRPLLAQVRGLASEQRKRWVQQVLGSIALTLAEKESMARGAANFSQFQVDELQKVSDREASRWQALSLDPAAWSLLQQTVLEGDFFPDALNAELARTQIRAWLSGNPEAFAFATSLVAERHPAAAAAHQLLAEVPLAELGSVPLLHSLTHFAVISQQMAVAEAAHRRSMEIDSKDTFPWNHLAYTLHFKLKRYDEAELAYRRAIALYPKDTSWYNLGTLLQFHLKRYDEAEVAYRKSIELYPKAAAIPWSNLGHLLQVHLKRYDDAIAAYRKSIELYPKDADSWNNLGHLLQVHLRRHDEAEAAYRMAIELNPKNAAPWNNLGSLLQVHFQRFEEAHSALVQAERLDPGHPYPPVNLARLLVSLDRSEEAAAAYRRALLLCKQAPGAEAAYADLRLQAHLWLGNQDAAAQALADLTAPLATDASSALAVYRLEEQAQECWRIGLGPALAKLLASSNQADRLRPMELALRLATGDEESLWSAPFEVQQMAREVAQRLFPAPGTESTITTAQGAQRPPPLSAPESPTPDG